ncbi:hypothetical protein acsn021_33730 [Anaerocolumna cellulosilytica]|uniref:Uncharacterized protein n=1 Tax=Anaerocolumna cellulosilytica TaxID=433286 RepID=A0A6S6QYU6_9FIRM|nr:hypothetical protein [Anaerocolumna cellulosilytica]MBB5196804.1 hypothetical protein [Anaerocolumna cellulosilytica]BCJ95804.1 hypothetical protein acsn021_33730 [Anaerocolumna cellulosilytica]
MKKNLLITLSLTVLAISGCSKADVEKQPVVIGNTAQLNVSTAPEASQTADAADTQEDKSKEDTKISEEMKENETIKGTTTNTVDNPAEEQQLQAEEVAREEAARQAEKERLSQNKPKESSEADPPLLVEVEGIKEAVPGKILKSEDGFEITYDSERFKHTKEGDVDSFAADNTDPAIYPYIYVNVSRIKNTTAREHAAKIITESEAAKYQSMDTTYSSTIGKNYDCIQITLQAGREWNSVIRNYYIIEADKAVYLVETQYFLEAEEGYGARIQAMLNTFYIPD